MNTVVIFITIGIITALIILSSLIYRNYSSKHPTIKAIKERLSFLNPKYKNIPLRVANNAYTENKSVIYVCLKHPNTGEIYDMNTLMYVTLHELAHVITPEYDNHGEEWQSNFTKLLNKAYAKGIYDPSKPIPKDYCAIESRRKNE